MPESRKFLLLALLAMAMLLTLAAAQADVRWNAIPWPYPVNQITDNAYDDEYPQIQAGQITWHSQVDGEDWEIMEAHVPEPDTTALFTLGLAACHIKGGVRLLEAVEQELAISEGESTPDLMFYLETVACLGACFLAPVMMIDNQYFGKLSSERVKTIIWSY